MADIIGINELCKDVTQFASIEEWKSFASKQLEVIDQYQQKIKSLESKNKQLESLLINQFTSSLATELDPAEVICIQQIERLEKLSAERQLTLDEVKRLDLLVKNLKLIREESTIIVNQKPDGLKEADLVAIVRASDSNQPS